MFCKQLLDIFILLQIIQIKRIFCFVDLFLNSNETSNLLGFSNTFFYIYNGELRQKSISYRLDIPIDKNEIEFNWKINGPRYLAVNYELSLVNALNSTTLSIDSKGLVPFNASSFRLNFDCAATKHKSKKQRTTSLAHTDISFNLYFKINETLTNNAPESAQASTVFQLKLATMPPLNFTIFYRKHCFDVSGKKAEKLINQKSKPQSNTSNFTIAYITIATLGGFSLLILIIAMFMCLNNRHKVKNLNEKYDYFQVKAKQQQQFIQNLNKAQKQHNKYYESKEQQFNSDNQLISSDNYTKSAKLAAPSMFVKNPANNSSKKFTSNSKSQPSSRPPSIYQKANEQDDMVNSNPNLYESVHDASVNAILTNETQNKKYSRMITSTSVNKQLLNITTNTIQSIVNTNNLTYTSRLKNQSMSAVNQLDLCEKFSNDQVTLDRIYLEGTFSKIYEGTLTRKNNESNGEDENSSSDVVVKVFVKVPNDQASTEQIDIMLKESSFLRGLKHKNVTSIIGVVRSPLVEGQKTQRPMALFNFCEIGNMKIFLASHGRQIRQQNLVLPSTPHLNSNNANQIISLQELLFIVLQLLKGINYIHSKHIIHKDIAARNCWLDANLSLKLADYALSRDLFPDDYNCLANNENKPTSWMSLESLKSNVYNIRSDIWSCGVTIWEILSLGAHPYENVDPFELADYLAENETNRLEKPLNCSTELYDVFNKCWLADPKSRPNLKALFHSIHKFYTNLNNYV